MNKKNRSEKKQKKVDAITSHSILCLSFCLRDTASRAPFSLFLFKRARA